VGLGPAQQVYCRGWSRVYLEARGEVYLGVELEMIYLGASKGQRSRHRILYIIYLTVETDEKVNYIIGTYFNFLNDIPGYTERAMNIQIRTHCTCLLGICSSQLSMHPLLSKYNVHTSSWQSMFFGIARSP